MITLFIVAVIAALAFAALDISGFVNELVGDGEVQAEGAEAVEIVDGKPVSQTPAETTQEDGFLSFPDDEEGAAGAETPGADAAQQPPSFTAIDPNTLPEEVKPFYKNMLADYTRKTQELAENRRQFEQQSQVYQSDFIQQAVQLQQIGARDPAQFLNAIISYADRARQYGIQQGLIDPATTPQLTQAELPEGVDYEDLTPTEQFLYNKVSQLGGKLTEAEQRLQAYEPVADESRRQAGQAKLTAAFTSIEGDLRIRLSENQKNEIAALAVQRGVRDEDGLKTVIKSWVFDKQRTSRSSSAQDIEKRSMGGGSNGNGHSTFNSNGAPALQGRKKLSIEEFVNNFTETG